LHLISLDNDDKLPQPVDKAERQCINCGHCVAVCRTGALCLKGVSPDSLTAVDYQKMPDAGQAKTFLTGRRSVRVYKKQPLEREKLAEIIDAARYAPSGVNSQPVHWLVITDPQEINRLTGLVIDWMRLVMEQQPDLARNFNMKGMVDAWDNGVDRICRSAPGIIVAHAPEANGASPSSCTIALTYLELAAFANGIGACWAGFFHTATTFYPPMLAALNLPEGHKCYGAMLVGYPLHKFYYLPQRKDASITWR